MKKLNNKLSAFFAILIVVVFSVTSCNKGLETLAPILPASVGVGTITNSLSISANDSLYYRFLVRSGQANLFNDSTKTFTLFATDNLGMKIFVNSVRPAIPLSAPNSQFAKYISDTFPVANAAGIIQYSTIGQKIAAATFQTIAPNALYPSNIILSAATPFLRAPIAITKGVFTYANSIQITAPDFMATNGIIHKTFTLIAPPAGGTLKTTIRADSVANSLRYFQAAVTRADSGQVNLNRFDSLLNYGVTNMTVLVPSDTAFKVLIRTLVYGRAISLGATPAMAQTQADLASAAGPAFLSTNNVSTAQIRGIIAYHILANNASGSYVPGPRLFSINLPTAPLSFVKTLVNSSFPTHPGIMVQATFAGPYTTNITFNGVGNFTGAPAFTGPVATVVSKDKIAVNGVYHVIDRVLLAQ
jgi:uncharacterized surface protein with fasciclin (FAS1) repeats